MLDGIAAQSTSDAGWGNAILNLKRIVLNGGVEIEIRYSLAAAIFRFLKKVEIGVDFAEFVIFAAVVGGGLLPAGSSPGFDAQRRLGFHCLANMGNAIDVGKIGCSAHHTASFEISGKKLFLNFSMQVCQSDSESCGKAR